MNVKRRGLELSSTAQVQMGGVREEQVVAQNPPANASQVAAPKISLLVTAAADPQAFVMANFVGQPLGSASRSGCGRGSGQFRGAINNDPQRLKRRVI